MRDESSESQSFESALAELETFVDRMESGKLPLAEMVSTYQKAHQLWHFCQQELAKAAMTIETIEQKPLTADEEEPPDPDSNPVF